MAFHPEGGAARCRGGATVLGGVLAAIIQSLVGIFPWGAPRYHRSKYSLLSLARGLHSDHTAPHWRDNSSSAA
eukprot:446340-Pyramimonas_sp.AAC.1